MKKKIISIIIFITFFTGFLYAQSSLPNIKLPLLVLKVNFTKDKIGLPPPPLNKEQVEALNKNPWQSLPITSYFLGGLGYITKTRVAKMVKQVNGLTDKPLLFYWKENFQPQYGPQIYYSIPQQIAKTGLVWKLSFNISKGNFASSGGVLLWDVGQVIFSGDGIVLWNYDNHSVALARYAPDVPLHIDCIINVEKKTVTVSVNKKGSITCPWYSPTASYFQTIRLDGLLPGGYAELGSIAFDNINLVLEKMKK
jgi:hypothetical protein